MLTLEGCSGRQPGVELRPECVLGCRSQAERRSEVSWTPWQASRRQNTLACDVARAVSKPRDGDGPHPSGKCQLERLLQEFGGLASRDIRYRDPSRDPGRGRGSAVTPANRERQGPAPLTACRLAPYQQAHWPGPPMATRGTMVAVPTGSGPSGERSDVVVSPPGSGPETPAREAAGR